VNLALALLAASLPPGTLSLEYNLVPSGELAIKWSTNEASGRLTRQLTPEDRAALTGLASAVSSPDSEWQLLADRAATLLLEGIQPLGSVRRLAISAHGEPLRSIPFEILGRPLIIERFTVWYASASEPAIRRLWTPEGPADFMSRYERLLSSGIAPAEALRRTKVDWLRSEGERSHPYYWAAFVLEGNGPGKAKRVIPWIWIGGLALLLASAGFLLWWRRSRFELL
jgi:hypothetical protein